MLCFLVRFVDHYILNEGVLRKYLVFLADTVNFSSPFLSECLSTNSNKVHYVDFIIPVACVNRKGLYCVKPLVFGTGL